MLYFKLGNNLMRILPIVFIIMVGCKGSSDFDWLTTTEITYINETSQTIFVKGVSCEVSNILPNETLIYDHVEIKAGNSKDDKPNLNNFNAFVPCDFYYGNTEICEREVNVRGAQENHKQIEDLEFEFTFRFTELRLQNATVCK